MRNATIMTIVAIVVIVLLILIFLVMGNKDRTVVITRPPTNQPSQPNNPSASLTVVNSVLVPRQTLEIASEAMNLQLNVVSDKSSFNAASIILVNRVANSVGRVINIRNNDNNLRVLVRGGAPGAQLDENLEIPPGGQVTLFSYAPNQYRVQQ